MTESPGSITEEEKEEDAVKQLKREFKEQKEAEKTKVKVLVKNIQVSHQKQLADMKEIITKEVDALKSNITEKDACIEKEKNTVKQLKNINKTIREQRGIAETKIAEMKQIKALEDALGMKEIKALVEEKKKVEEELAKRPAEGAGGGESHQRSCWIDRNGVLEAENEQLKAKNTEIKETCAMEEERAKQVLKSAMDKTQKSEDEKKELVAETEQLKAENTELKKENAKQIIQKSEMEKTTKLVAELQEKVECPVCLVVPREGPVPCCPSGHIICSPCLGKLRTEGRLECPTCRVPMGEGKSALARHIIENMEHQCRHQGCAEMVAFGDQAHQASCEQRLVVCPGPTLSCGAMVAFCKVKDHAKACQVVFENKQLKQGHLFSIPETMIDVLPRMSWPSLMFAADNGDTFFLRMSRANKHFSLEVVMLGTQEACEAYTMEVAVMNPDTRKVAFSANFKPRPIVTTNVTDEFCMTIKQESLAKIWRFNKEHKMFEFIISVQIKI